MKIVQVVPKSDCNRRLKTLLKEKELELRGKGTAFVRDKEGRWKHAKYTGWINWAEAKGGLLVAEIQSRREGAEWQILSAFIGYLDRHFSEQIESISIYYR